MDLNSGNRSAGAVALSGGSTNGALSLLRNAGIVLAGSALIAVCAHLSIPLWFTPVPVTLQPFAVVLLGLLLAPELAFGAAVAYLAEGAAGLPVFTPSGPGGMIQLLGPTGGYLFSYPLVAAVVAWLYRLEAIRGLRSFTRGVIAAGVGNVVTLSMGAVWLGVWTHHSSAMVLNQAVLPFLPGDVLKVIAAAGIATGVVRWRRQS